MPPVAANTWLPNAGLRALNARAVDRKNVLFLEKYTRWHCRAKHDAPQFTLKTGTVMEDSPIGLEKWLPVFWLLCNCKNGISSYELHRALGVTQKSAWFMLHRIREGMKNGNLSRWATPAPSKSTRLSSAAR